MVGKRSTRERGRRTDSLTWFIIIWGGGGTHGQEMATTSFPHLSRGWTTVVSLEQPVNTIVGRDISIRFAISRAVAILFACAANLESSDFYVRG